MAQWRLRASLALAFVCVGMGGGPAESASSISLQRDGAVAIAGRVLRCGGVRNVLNPGLLSRQSEIVRLFVFHHECGHHHVGGNELKADCWAVNEGVKAGWLDREGLAQACRSFGDAPATATHPSGARRCANLDRCFATAVAAHAKELAAQQTPRPDLVAARVARDAPKLVSGPTLVRSGTLR